MKNIGVDGLVSSNDLANSMVRFSVYLGPSFSSMKSLHRRKILRKSKACKLNSIRLDSSYATAYVIRSGRNARIIHNLCRAVLFFHSCGNFSFSGQSDSTSFFHRFEDVSMSRSRFLLTVDKFVKLRWQIGISIPAY